MTMASKRNHGNEGMSSRSKAPSRGNDSNPFGIIFRDNMHKTRYEALIKCKIINTHYLDDHILDILGRAITEQSQAKLIVFRIV